MKLNKVLIYLAILVVVAGYVYFVEIKHKEKTEAAKEKAERIIDLDKDKVTGIQLKSGEHGTIQVMKPTDKWVMTQPVKTKADDKAVNDLIFAATTGKREKIVKETDVDWKEFGLEKPDFQVILNTKDKSETISFGATNPAKSSYYVRVNDSPSVLLVANTLKNSLNKTPFALREKSVLAMAPQDVDLVAYSMNSEKVEIKRDKKGGWLIEKPEKLRAKASVVDKDLITLTNLTARNIIDKPEKDGDPYGLARPETTIRLAGTKLEQTLLVGKTVSEKDGGTGAASDRYAKVKGFDTVYVIPDSTLKRIRTTVKDIQDRSMLAFDVGDVTKMDITFDGTQYVAVKGAEGKWALEKPAKKDDLEAWQITSILWDIKDLEWKSFKKEVSGDLAAYHLDRPGLVVSLLKKDGKEPLILKAGWQSEGQAPAQEPAKADKPQKTEPSDKQEAQPQRPPETPPPGFEETPLYPHKIKPDIREIDPDAPLPGESKKIEPSQEGGDKKAPKPASEAEPKADEPSKGKESADSSEKPKIPQKVFVLAEPHDYKGAVFTMDGASLGRLLDDLKKLGAEDEDKK